MSRLIRRSTAQLTEAEQFFREGQHVALFPVSFALITAANVTSTVMTLLAQA